MSARRIKSKPIYFPELEAPKVAVSQQQGAMRLISSQFQITGFDEGHLGFARLSRAKYLAILAIGALSALILSQP